MTLHTFLLFVFASFALALAPGPDMMYTLGRSIAQGRRAGILSAIGFNLGGYVHFTAAVLGLSATMATSAVAFTIHPKPLLPSATINQAVTASLPRWHGKKGDIVDHLDLTRPFDTRSQWTLVAAKFPGPPPTILSESETGGPLALCFVNDLIPRCTYKYPHTGSSFSWFDVPYHVLSSKIVFAGTARTDPLLLVKTASGHALTSYGIETQLFTYERQTNHFEPIFSNSTGSNNNQETRFVAQGPLHGDIIVATPTARAPYAYWITVYVRAKQTQHYHLALRYRSATHYGDGNPLPAIDSEMPNILKRFDKWKTGDPLPIPRQMPSDCTHHLFLAGDEEWCLRKRNIYTGDLRRRAG
ncbi:MAG: LysE family translocator [Steroidobacteraceae bacterium]